MSPEKKRAMIKRDHPALSISQQCKLVRLSRSAFYYTPVGINADTLAIMKEIDRVFTKYPFFGSRQIAAYLRREGTVVGRHRVRRLMAKMGLEAIYKRPRTSQPCQRRVKNPQKCRSKIPHLHGSGDQPVSVICDSVIGFWRPAAPLRRRWRGDGCVGPDMLGDEVGMAAEPVTGALDLDDHGVVQQPVE